MQYVSLESHISGLWCCLNTQLSHKSKCHYDINLVTLNFLVASQQQKITFLPHFKR